MEKSPTSTDKSIKAVLDEGAEELPGPVMDDLAVLHSTPKEMPGPMATEDQAVLLSIQEEIPQGSATRPQKRHQVSSTADEGTATFRPRAVSAEPEVLQLRVLYLFAGAKRKGDIKYYMNKLSKYVQKAFNHFSHAVRIEVLVDEIDVVRGKAKGNLLNPKLRVKYMNKVSAGDYHVVLGSPPMQHPVQGQTQGRQRTSTTAL